MILDRQETVPPGGAVPGSSPSFLEVAKKTLAVRKESKVTEK